MSLLRFYYATYRWRVDTAVLWSHDAASGADPVILRGSMNQVRVVLEHERYRLMQGCVAS